MEGWEDTQMSEDGPAEKASNMTLAAVLLVQTGVVSLDMADQVCRSVHLRRRNHRSFPPGLGLTLHILKILQFDFALPQRLDAASCTYMNVQVTHVNPKLQDMSVCRHLV